MNFRRLPFQFSTTDPVERQRELERRFGFPSSNNMYVDSPNPLLTGAVQKETSSPRLQHRVPIFAEGYDHPFQSSVDSMGSVSENKKSNVRVIPIEIEGAESRPVTRHRTFSGPAGVPRKQNEGFIPERNEASPVKRSTEDLFKPSKVKHNAGSRVFNIPIQVEGGNNLAKSPNVDKVIKVKKDCPNQNGCSLPNSLNKVKSPNKKQKEHPETGTNLEVEVPVITGIENSLKKIADVLAEFKSYEAGVQEFSGTSKDKQYRYLDEMLTRCMLRLDDIDTMGNENVRLARKSAVKTIQASIDLLESKANAMNEISTNENKVQSSEAQISEASKETPDYENGIEKNDIDMIENDTIQMEVQDHVNALIVDNKVESITNTENVTVENKPLSQVKDEGSDVDIKENCNIHSEVQNVTTQSEIQETNTSEMSDSCQNDPRTVIDRVEGYEMQDNKCIDNKQDTSAEITKVSLNQCDVSKVDIQVESQPEVEKSTEVEMANNLVTSSEDLNVRSNINEEMVNYSIPDCDTEITNIVQDVEMKDIHENDAAEIIVSENTDENISNQSGIQNICASNQSEEQDEIVTKAETFIDDAVGKSVSTELSD